MDDIFNIHNRTLVIRAGLLIICDAVLVGLSMLLALLVRFDMQLSAVDPLFLDSLRRFMPITIIINLIVFSGFHLYTSLWRFASSLELRNNMLAVAITTVLQAAIMYMMGAYIPRSFPFLFFVILLAGSVLLRFSYRAIRVSKHNREIAHAVAPISTMIVGAGAAGYNIIREMKNSKHMNRKIPCIIDDDPKKIGSYLQGVRIVGNSESIPYYAEKYNIQEIVIAIPTLTGKEKKRLLGLCQKTKCKILILPGIYQLVNEEVSVSMLRQVEIEDLLGREQKQVDLSGVHNTLHDKVVLVTGGGGSIGSEICRQVAAHAPKMLIIFDIYENNAYDIQNELKREYPDLALETLIGSVQDKERINFVFEQYHPQIIFHAAAHKHVPLMETSPWEAIKNNSYGTWLVAEAADRYHAEKMVLISTDKAVRPTNVMGASKRICEMVIESFAKDSETTFACVRFGNVLGSNGSVIPLFRRQIASGGPVTVTDPNVIRYFMTIPEAVSLVLQCGELAGGGELFILDMGEPVKILDLAENMIRLSGLKPYEDIEIKFTGLRPGEKLYEELLINEKNLARTSKDGIFVAKMEPLDRENFRERLMELYLAAKAEDPGIREKIRAMVPEYTILGNGNAAQQVSGSRE